MLQFEDLAVNKYLFLKDELICVYKSRLNYALLIDFTYFILNSVRERAWYPRQRMEQR